MRARHVGAGLAIPLALAALGACAAYEEVISPSWRGPATVPIGTEYTPPEASRRGIEGWVLLRCIADQAQTPTDCIVIGETPAGVGFGAAALRMTPNTSTQHIVDPGMSPPAPGDPVLVPAIFCQPIAHTRCAEMQQAAAALGARYNQIAELIAAGHCPDARAAAAATTQPGLEHFVEGRCVGR